ncbi:hypothetical protein [Novosphingobium aquae]|uniref:Uncharacterized protein n=1 Tax=Novosphingobium aquae TaxID=3133435 RepID=A0ABU8S579_9SPHN
MIALGPKDIANAIGTAVLVGGMMHLFERCLSGYLQCRALGCLPTGLF